MKKKRIKNLDEKIYFICFLKPCFKEEIATILYGEGASSYRKIVGTKTGKIYDLSENKKWLGRIDYKKYYRPQWWPFEERNDGRGWRRDYFTALANPLIDKIQGRTNLTEFDRHVLQNIFNAKAFRDSICFSKPVFDLILKNDVFSPLDFILFQFEYWTVTYSKNDILLEIGKRLNDKKIYDQTTKTYRNAVEQQDILKYKKKYESDPNYEEIKDLKSTKDLQKKIEGLEYLIFIPTDVINKIKGSSPLGLIEQVFLSIDENVKATSQAIFDKTPGIVESFSRLNSKK